MNDDLKNAIEQLKDSPSGKLFPCLLLLGSTMTTNDPQQWLIDAINTLQKKLVEKEKADLFFMMGTHTVKIINDNDIASVLGSDKPSLETIDLGLAEAIKSLFLMVKNQHLQQDTLNDFYRQTYQWLELCFEKDTETKNPTVINFLQSLQPLMVAEQENVH